MAARLTIVVFLARITIPRPLQYSGSGLGPLSTNSYHVASYCFFDKKHSSNYNWSRLGGGREGGWGLLYFTNNSFVSQTEPASSAAYLQLSSGKLCSLHSNQQKYPERYPAYFGRVQGRVRRDGDKIVSS